MNLTNRIRDVIESNFVPPDRRKVGVEIECLFYQADGQRIPVNPTNRFSATDFLGTLEAMQREDAAKSWYSLEPGGQLEWASPPELSLRTLQDRFQRHFHRAQEIATKQNLTQLDVSLEPIWTPDNIDLIAQKIPAHAQYVHTHRETRTVDDAQYHQRPGQHRLFQSSGRRRDGFHS